MSATQRPLVTLPLVTWFCGTALDLTERIQNEKGVDTWLWEGPDVLGVSDNWAVS